MWKKSFFWHIPYLCLTWRLPQLSCDGRFLLQSLLPAIAVTAHPLLIIAFILPSSQIIVYLVSLWMLFLSVLHTSFLHSYFDVALRWGQEECSS